MRKTPSGKITTPGMTISLMVKPNVLREQKHWDVLGEITSPPLLMCPWVTFLALLSPSPIHVRRGGSYPILKWQASVDASQLGGAHLSKAWRHGGCALFPLNLDSWQINLLWRLKLAHECAASVCTLMCVPCAYGQWGMNVNRLIATLPNNSDQ